MAVADSGSWKLIIYSLVIIFIVGFVLNMTISPFIDSGIQVQNETTPIQTGLENIVSTGNVFNITEIDLWLVTIPVPNVFNLIGDSGKTFMMNQIHIFTWLPTAIQIPILIIILVAFIYVVWTLIAMLIP